MYRPFTPDVLSLLACPEDGSPLRWAPAPLVQELNRQVDLRELHDLGGGLVDRHMDLGLLRDDGQRLYPVRAGVADLLVDSAVLIVAL